MKRINHSHASPSYSLPRYSGGGRGWGLCFHGTIARVLKKSPLPNHPPEYRGRGKCGTSLLAVVMLLLSATFASAHALPDRSEPRVGSTVDKSPKEVRIYFNQDLESAFSRIQVFDSSGKEVDKKDSHVDPGNKRLLIVSVPELAAGKYKVHWSVVSIDTHRTQNDFKFEIKP